MVRGPSDLPKQIEIRWAYYEGITRYCLETAWEELNKFRQEQSVRRYFRGRYVIRKTIPYVDIANTLGRDAGEIGKWFRGESPHWEFLMLSMMVLNAEWSNLGLMPDKIIRKKYGWIRALVLIQKKKNGIAETDTVSATLTEMTVLRTLFLDEEWVLFRKDKVKREDLLERLSQRTNLEKGVLDRIDRCWGDDWLICTSALEL